MPARGAFSSRRGELSQSFDVAHRWFTEVPFVLPAEVGRVFVADPVVGLRGVEILAEHQPAGLPEPQLLLKLQRAHRRDGPEMRVESRDAHAELPRDVLDPQRLIEVLAQLLARAESSGLANSRA